MPSANAPVFSFGSDHAHDLLENAACVTCFLVEVAASMTSANGDVGLSAKGADGLAYILVGVENTIKAAQEAIGGLTLRR